MTEAVQLSLESPLRELAKPVQQSAVQIVQLPIAIRPVGLDECWRAFLCLSGTAEPSVSLASPGLSDGVPIGVPYILSAVLEGRGFPFFGPFAGSLTRTCDASDALALLQAVAKAIPKTNGAFVLGWMPDDPMVPF